MADEWFYSRQGVRSGPFTKQQVASLAAAGQISPADLLWKSGTKAWAPAERFTRLFPKCTRQSECVSKLAPLGSSSNLSKAPETQWSADARSTAEATLNPAIATAAAIAPAAQSPAEKVGAPFRHGSAAETSDVASTLDPRTVQVPNEDAQVIRAKLLSGTLPQAYRNLGLHLQTSGGFTHEFPDLYRHMNRLMASLASFDEAAESASAINPAKTLTQRQSLLLRIDQILQQLGEMAFKKHGTQSGPAEITECIVAARSQLTAINPDVIRKLPRNRFTTRKNLLVGGVAAALVARLTRRGNVHFTGPVSYLKIPEYMRAFDACIVPHRVTPFTESLNPIKLWEYLAAGKPIVSTPVAGFRDYPQFVSLAANADQFVAAMHAALLEDPALPSARQAEAAKHSWSARVDQIEAVLNDVINKKNGGTGTGC